MNVGSPNAAPRRRPIFNASLKFNETDLGPAVPMLRYLIKRESLLATAVVFLFFFLLSLFPWRDIDSLDPLSEALSDFQLTDIVFSKFRDPQPPDSNIVIVNIGRMNRANIGRAVARIAQHQPAVIGIDAFFRQLKTPDGDSTLAAALQRHGANIILVNELSDYDPTTARFNGLLTSHPSFNKWVSNGYANVTNDPNSPKTIRSISPQQPVGDRVIPSFALALVQRYDSAAARRTLSRGNEQEVINWRGNYSNFYFLDTAAVLDTTVSLEVVRGKIVLMAFIDVIDRIGSLEDRYFTPINERYAGKSFPDMYGIVIHANMISMMLSGEYVNHMPPWLGILLAITLCHLVMAFLLWWYDHHGEWFDLVVFVTAVLLNLVLLYLVILLFDRFRYELDVKLAILALVFGPSILEIFIPIYRRLTRARTA